MRTRLEIPLFGAGSASAAIGAGAARLELNAAGSYRCGGLSPSLDELACLRRDEASAAVPVRVMIRPRAGDFRYRDRELDAMERAILRFRDSGLLRQDRGDGFVLGVVRDAAVTVAAAARDAAAGGGVEIDGPACRRLLRAVRPFKAVFHRAFDDAVVGCAGGGGGGGDDGNDDNLERAVRQLVDLGFDGVLTSGGRGNAADNVQALQRIRLAAAPDLEVIVGGGVRSGNVRALVDGLRLGRSADDWLHSSCLPAEGEAVDVRQAEAIVALFASALPCSPSPLQG